jgi:hypothetical protein
VCGEERNENEKLRFLNIIKAKKEQNAYNSTIG